MQPIEANVIHSFRRAKSDIIRLQNDFLQLSKTQERIAEMLNDLNNKELTLYHNFKNLDARIVERPAATRSAKKLKTYLATKGGKNFHITSCPYAQNIKPKNRIKFKSRSKALNQGFKPCKCTR